MDTAWDIIDDFSAAPFFPRLEAKRIEAKRRRWARELEAERNAVRPVPAASSERKRPEWKKSPPPILPNHPAARRYFENLPAWPDGAKTKKEGVKKRDRCHAARLPFIQTNPRRLVRYLVLDIDAPGATIFWEVENLPRPTVVITNPTNGHAQYLYELVDPVSSSKNARDEPQKYLDAVRKAYAARLGADCAFAGHLMKNPLSDKWLVSWHDEKYTLAYLADFVDLAPRIRVVVDNTSLDGENRIQRCAESRNWTLFYLGGDYLRETNDVGGVESYLSNINDARHLDGRPPLPAAEVATIAKSLMGSFRPGGGDGRIRNRGRMGLDKIQGLDLAEYRREKKRRQAAGGRFAAARNQAGTDRRIAAAVERLEASGDALTVSAVSRSAGVSRNTATVYRDRHAGGWGGCSKRCSGIHPDTAGAWVSAAPASPLLAGGVIPTGAGSCGVPVNPPQSLSLETVIVVVSNSGGGVSPRGRLDDYRGEAIEGEGGSGGERETKKLSKFCVKAPAAVDNLGVSRGWGLKGAQAPSRPTGSGGLKGAHSPADNGSCEEPRRDSAGRTEENTEPICKAVAGGRSNRVRRGPGGREGSDVYRDRGRGADEILRRSTGPETDDRGSPGGPQGGSSPLTADGLRGAQAPSRS